MAIPDFDPRNGGTCANIMAKRFTCAVVGIIQVIFWGSSLLAIIFRPSSASVVVEKLDTKAEVIVNILIITCFCFSCVLVAGVYKNKQLHIKIYLVYVIVFVVLLLVSLIVNIFTQPKVVGFRGFFSTVLFILLFTLCFFIVRCHYLNTYCSAPRRQVGPNKI